MNILQDTFWINVYPNGSVSPKLFTKKEFALCGSTYTEGKPDAEQVLVKLVPVKEDA